MAKRIEFKLDGEDYLELGDAALQKGEYEKAISYFRTACSVNDDSESYTALGVAYSKLHELDASNAALYKAMTRALTDEDENPALWQLCLNAAEAGEEDVASYYLRYLGEDDGAAEIRRVPSGEGMFKIADKPAVEFCKTMLQRAGEAFADERPDDAIRYLDELGDAPEPYLTMAQRLRTVCLFAKGDLDRVISVCEEIEKKSPDADNKVTLAAAYCFQGRYDDVDRVLDEVLAADDIPEYVTLKLLHLLVERQRDADILQITEKLSRHARLWHASEMFRSEALYNLGKRQEAVRVMKRVDNVFGEFSAAHYYLGIYEGEPEKVPYGCEMPQECQLAIVRGIKQITDGGDVTRLQRALTYDAAFNRDLRWVIDNCADIIACPVLMYLSDIRSRAVEKIFRDRLIGVRLSFDQMTLAGQVQKCGFPASRLLPRAAQEVQERRLPHGVRHSVHRRGSDLLSRQAVRHRRGSGHRGRPRRARVETPQRQEDRQAQERGHHDRRAALRGVPRRSRPRRGRHGALRAVSAHLLQVPRHLLRRR